MNQHRKEQSETEGNRLQPLNLLRVIKVIIVIRWLTKTELLELLEIAKHAARLAAAVHRRAMNSARLKFDTKSSTCDLVTEIDREAEKQLQALDSTR